MCCLSIGKGWGRPAGRGGWHSPPWPRPQEEKGRELFGSRGTELEGVPGNEKPCDQAAQRGRRTRWGSNSGQQGGDGRDEARRLGRGPPQEASTSVGRVGHWATLQMYHRELACALFEKNVSPRPVEQRPPGVTSLNIKKDIGK